MFVLHLTLLTFNNDKSKKVAFSYFSYSCMYLVIYTTHHSLEKEEEK